MKVLVLYAEIERIVRYFTLNHYSLIFIILFILTKVKVIYVNQLSVMKNPSVYTTYASSCGKLIPLETFYKKLMKGKLIS